MPQPQKKDSREHAFSMHVPGCQILRDWCHHAGRRRSPSYLYGMAHLPFFYRYPTAGLIGHKVRHVSLPARPEIRWREQKAFDGVERDTTSGIPSPSRFYQMFRRFSLGMYRESFSVILKASYHASMCGRAPFTRHSPSECGSLLVRLRISSSRMLAAHTLA